MLSGSLECRHRSCPTPAQSLSQGSGFRVGMTGLQGLRMSPLGFGTFWRGFGIYEASLPKIMADLMQAMSTICDPLTLHVSMFCT